MLKRASKSPCLPMAMLVPGPPSVLTEVTWESLGPKASPAPSTHLKPVTTHHHHLRHPTLRPAPAWFIFVMSLCCCYLGNIPWKMLGEVGRLTGRGRPQTHCGWMAGGRLSHEGLSASHPRTAHPILPALFSQPPPQAKHQVCAFLGEASVGWRGVSQHEPVHTWHTNLTPSHLPFFFMGPWSSREQLPYPSLWDRLLSLACSSPSLHLSMGLCG